MINPQELLFIVDENNKPLEPTTRQVAHKNGLWHRTTGIWIINSSKQVLCQKRSMKKDVKAGLWEAFFGGHLAPGQDYTESALQELHEELGIKVLHQELHPYKVFKNEDVHCEFEHIFGYSTDRSISDFKIETDEVDELRWVNLEELRRILGDLGVTTWVHKPWDQEVLSWLPTMNIA